MARNWTREELAEVLARNESFKVRRVEIPPAQTRHNRAVIAPESRGGEIANGVRELMGAPSFQGRLEPEDQLSYAVATALRQQTNAGKLRAVWFGIPIQHPAGGKYAMLAQAKRTCLGAVPGTPDFGFIWDTGGGFIELKTEAAQGSLLMPSGKAGISRARRRSYLSQRQRLFATWCQQCNVRHGVARSVLEVLQMLRGWEVLT